jgi:N-acyl-D-amino-acid deacylase
MTFSFVDWNRFDDSEPWCEATTGSLEERMAKLSAPRRRLAMKNDMPQLITNEFDQIFIVTVENDELKGYENLTIAEASQKSGKHPADLMLDLALADGLKTEFFAPAVNRRTDLMREPVGYEWTIPGVSDGGAHTKFFCGGRYPTEFITEIVRKNEMITLEDAHWRLSALPAWCAGFKNRGMIREGYAADVVIYDFDKLAVRPMEVARDLPGGEWRRVQKADGYELVMVNGQTAMKNGKPTGAMAGRLLRHGIGREQTIAGK